MTRRSKPRLNARILASSEAFSRVLGTLVEEDTSYKRQRRRIIHAQRRLRACVSDDAWDLYLRIEEVSAARLGIAIALAARWAYKQGRRH